MSLRAIVISQQFTSLPRGTLRPGVGRPHVGFDFVLLDHNDRTVLDPDSHPKLAQRQLVPVKFLDTPEDINRRVIDRTREILESAGYVITAADITVL
jgi:hypothetical protein